MPALDKAVHKALADGRNIPSDLLPVAVLDVWCILDIVINIRVVHLAAALRLGDEPVAPQMTAVNRCQLLDVGQQAVHHLIEQAGVESVHLRFAGGGLNALV